MHANNEVKGFKKKKREAHTLIIEHFHSEFETLKRIFLLSKPSSLQRRLLLFLSLSFFDAFLSFIAFILWSLDSATVDCPLSLCLHRFARGDFCRRFFDFDCLLPASCTPCPPSLQFAAFVWGFYSSKLWRPPTALRFKPPLFLITHFFPDSTMVSQKLFVFHSLEVILLFKNNCV